MSAGWANGARLWEGQQLQTLASLSKTDRVFQIGKLRSELEMGSGNVRVMSEMLTELVPNHFFGEMGLLEKLPRSAATASSRCGISSAWILLPTTQVSDVFGWSLNNSSGASLSTAV